MTRRRHLAQLLALTVAPAASPLVMADTWPSRPIRFVIPYPAGGSTDVAGRLLAQEVSTRLGVPFVVENIGGAGGVLGSDQVRRATPDGYTVVMGSSASHSVNTVAMKNNPYDPVTDFAPVIMVSKYANAAFVPAASPAKTLADLEAMIRKDPGFTYATAGPGSTSYLSGELLRLHAKLKMTPVHYKGIGPAMQDVIAGHVQLGFGDVVALSPHIASGRLRILAVTSEKRVATLPDLPAVSETYPGYESVAWQALFAPKATPEPVIRRLNAEFARALATPAIRTKLEGMGAELIGGSPQNLTTFVKADIAKWQKLVAELKLTFE